MNSTLGIQLLLIVQLLERRPFAFHNYYKITLLKIDLPPKGKYISSSEVHKLPIHLFLCGTKLYKDVLDNQIPIPMK